MIRSDELEALSAALSAAQGEFEAIAKTDNNPFFKSKYAPLPEVIAAATPVLVKHGLAVWQGSDVDDQGELLWTVVLHSSGQFLGSSARLRPVKNDPQAQGSAVTYQRRYQYMAALGLVADEDDDGNAASERSKPVSGAKSSRRPSAKGSSSEGRRRPAGGPHEASKDTPGEKKDGGAAEEGIKPDTLEALARTFKESGLDQARLKGIFAEAGAEGKQPRELTEAQGEWVLIALREAKPGE